MSASAVGSQPPGPVLRTVGLTKRYTDFWGRPRVTALDNLSLEVQPGEVFGLLGPNGSGKTTTIKLLLGLLRPTAGDAMVFGRSAEDPAVKARIGYLPEETYLYRFLDADETMAFFGGIFRLSRATIKSRSDELLRMVGLEAVRKRRLGEYSKGMARRLGLAQALINDPALVILDEPTSGLDPIGSAEVKDLIIRLKQAGKTVLLCSHLLADVEDVCDRMAILYNGKLLECGPVAGLLADDTRVQIELSAGDPGVLDAVRAAAGSSLRSIGPPRERLEARFRRLIAEAKGAGSSQP
jgi:ABC-2 type transport system ATP-binding protein